MPFLRAALFLSRLLPYWPSPSLIYPSSHLTKPRYIPPVRRLHSGTRTMKTRSFYFESATLSSLILYSSYQGILGGADPLRMSDGHAVTSRPLQPITRTPFM